MGRVYEALKKAATEGSRPESSIARAALGAAQPRAFPSDVDILASAADNVPPARDGFPDAFASIPRNLTVAGDPIPVWACITIELPDDEIDAATPFRPVSFQPTVSGAQIDQTAPVDFAPDAERKLGISNRELIVAEDANPEYVRQFELAADALLSRQLATGLKTLLVSSAVPGEGRTLTVANLALTLSEKRGQRVLVIDADLTAPRIHEVFGIPNERGLREALNSPEPVRLVSLSTRLRVMTAGNTAGAARDALVSPRFRDVLEEAARSVDWILIDSPPVSVQTDADLLGWLTDGVVLIVARGTPVRTVRETVREFGTDRCIGLIFNRSV